MFRCPPEVALPGEAWKRTSVGSYSQGSVSHLLLLIKKKKQVYLRRVLKMLEAVLFLSGFRYEDGQEK